MSWPTTAFVAASIVAATGSSIVSSAVGSRRAFCSGAVIYAVGAVLCALASSIGVVIAGRFDGVIFAKGRVEIEPKGVVTGEVHAPCMVIDPGGIFDGRCHMLASSDAVAGVTIPIRAVGSA